MRNDFRKITNKLLISDFKSSSSEGGCFASVLAEPDVSVNVDFSFFDSEETVFTPVGVPGVGADPIFDLLLIVRNTITNDLNSVSTFEGTSCVLIDSTFVVHEIFIDIEASLDWAVSENFILNAVYVVSAVSGFN